MTKNHAEKRLARAYAQAHDLPYRQALASVRAARADPTPLLPFAQRLLIEAVEGCGVRHWACVDEWDGVGRATITDLGGERFVLTVDSVLLVLREHLDENPTLQPNDIDSYFADEAVQRVLFGGVIYRLDLHRGRGLVA
ncbi:hypothetical protein [Rhodococcus sp. AW25M09]|uniref:hypothetical protein n=1 Tax=Rhodococcus sp. AW25M09 TaxID=1268303 RepID=UPI000346CA03|nr:hypothetical protein [Rhodococcus sp. AW25M09]